MNKAINTAIAIGIFLVLSLTAIILIDPFHWFGNKRNASNDITSNVNSYFGGNSGLIGENKSIKPYDTLLIKANELIDIKDYYNALNTLAEADAYLSEAGNGSSDELERVYNNTLVALAKEDEEKGVNRDYSLLLLDNRRSVRSGKIYDDIDRTINSAIFRAKALNQYAESLDLLFIADQMYPNPKQQILISNLYASITDQLREKDKKSNIKRVYQTLEERRKTNISKIYNSEDLFEEETSDTSNIDTELALSTTKNDIQSLSDSSNTKKEIKSTEPIVSKKEEKPIKNSSKNNTKTTENKDAKTSINTKIEINDDKKPIKENTANNVNNKNNEIRNQNTNDPIMLKAMGDEAYENKDLDLAYQYYSKYIANRSNDLEIVYRISLIEIEKKQYDKAIKNLLFIMKYKAGLDRTLLKNSFYALGIIYELKNDPLKAIGYYNEAVKWDDKFVKPMVQMGKIYYKQGLDNIRTSQFDKAKEILTKAYKIEPENYEVLILLGKTEEKLKNISQAIEFYRKATYVKPDGYSARVLLAESLSSIGKVNEALAQFEIAISNSNNEDVSLGENISSDFLLEYANTLRQAKRLDESEIAYQKALDKGAKDYLVYLGLASVSFNKGNYEASIEYMKKVIQIKGERMEYLMEIATAYNVLGDFESAIRYYKKAISFNPENPILKEELAKAYFSISKYDEGIEILENSIKSNIATAETYQLLGETYLEIEQKENAITIFNKLIKKYPDYKNIDLINEYLKSATME